MNQPGPTRTPPAPSQEDEDRTRDAAAHRPEPVDLASESVAGEEDPGAALELAVIASRKHRDATRPDEPKKDPASPGEASPDAPKPTGE